MDDELKELQASWQGGVPADLELTLRRAAVKAERSNRWGRWLVVGVLVLFLPMISPGLLGWRGGVESLLVSSVAAVVLVLCVIALLRWPRFRSKDAAFSSLRGAVEGLLSAREHRLWLWTGWLVRLAWLLLMALMLALFLGGVLRPRWDVDTGRARLVLAWIVAYVVVVLMWRELACARIDSQIDRLRVILRAQGGDPPSSRRALGGIPRPWQRRILLACESIVLVVAIGLAWRGPAADVVAAREYMQQAMAADDWASAIRGLDLRSQAPADDVVPTGEEIARYCEVRQRVGPSLRAMQEAEADVLVGARLALFGDPDGEDMVEWQSAGARWEDARRNLLYEAHRALWRKHLGPSRLRWMGEWVEWRALARPEAAAFALRGADARRWFALRLRAHALSELATATPEERDRLGRARTEAQSELARLETIARSRSVAAPAIPLDACPPGSLEPIDNIAWLALLDAPEPIWEEAAW